MAGLTTRKKRPLVRTRSTTRDTRLIVIATEGSDTEKVYFDASKFSNVQVRVIPSVGGKSAPQHILENAVNYAEEYQIGGGDEIWIVVDFDRWPQGNLAQVAKTARAKGFKLAVSNPCFELWLALHLEAPLPQAVTPASLEGHLRSKLGSFSKTKYDGDRLVQSVDSAIEIAGALNYQDGDRWPQLVGTHCFKLAVSILGQRRRSAIA